VGRVPVTAARLAERGIATARDLLMRLPRGYDDLGRVTPSRALRASRTASVVLVRGTVRRCTSFRAGCSDVIVEEGGRACARAGSARTRRWRRRS
jgi:RecG-like helicase